MCREIRLSVNTIVTICAVLHQLGRLQYEQNGQNSIFSVWIANFFIKMLKHPIFTKKPTSKKIIWFLKNQDVQRDEAKSLNKIVVICEVLHQLGRLQYEQNGQNWLKVGPWEVAMETIIVNCCGVGGVCHQLVVGRCQPSLSYYCIFKW